MDELLEYRVSDYFNDKDLYLFDNTLGALYVSQVHWYNGSWYSNESMKFKMTTIRCVSCNELYHKKVRYKGTEVTGIITKFLDPDVLGINWDGGLMIKKYGNPYFWNYPKNLELWKDK